jgi:hypothetical protein
MTATMNGQREEGHTSRRLRFFAARIETVDAVRTLLRGRNGNPLLPVGKKVCRGLREEVTASLNMRPSLKTFAGSVGL